MIKMIFASVALVSCFSAAAHDVVVVERGPVYVEEGRYRVREHGEYVRQYCRECGRVERVFPIVVYTRPTGIGVVGGALIGGLLGNQVGRGNGRTAATIAGTLGGGYIGNEIESRQATTMYRVRVRMDSGRSRAFDYAQSPGLYPGQRVRVYGNQVVPG